MHTLVDPCLLLFSIILFLLFINEGVNEWVLSVGGNKGLLSSNDTIQLSTCAALLLLSGIIQNVQADADYFNKPVAASTFSPCQHVDFVLDKMENDEDQIILAQLYRHEEIHNGRDQEEEEDDGAK